MKNRRGISLIEILVAVSVFGVSAVGLVQLSMTGSQRGVKAAGVGQQTALLVSEFQRATAVPAAASVAGITCDTLALSEWRFSRCTRIVTVDSRRQRVSVVVSPVTPSILSHDSDDGDSHHSYRASRSVFRPDSLTVVRAANVGALTL